MSEELFKVTTSKVFLIPVQAIISDPASNFSRFSPGGNIEQLAHSMRSEGQIQPIGVTRHDENFFNLSWGDRRYRAAKWWNDTHPDDPMMLKAILLDKKKYNSKDLFFMNMEENNQRQSLSHMDIAVLCRHMSDNLGMKQSDIAKKFYTREGSPQNIMFVSSHLQLCGLTPEVQMQVHNGEISMATALDMARNMTEAEQKQVAEEVAEVAEIVKDELKDALSGSDEKQVAAANSEVKKNTKKAAAQAVASRIAKDKPKQGSRTTKEIVEFFERFSPSGNSQRACAFGRFMVRFVAGDDEFRDDKEVLAMLEYFLNNPGCTSIQKAIKEASAA